MNWYFIKILIKTFYQINKENTIYVLVMIGIFILSWILLLIYYLCI